MLCQLGMKVSEDANEGWKIMYTALVANAEQQPLYPK